MKHAMAKQRGGHKARIAIAGFALALPCTFLSELPAPSAPSKVVEYPYILTAAIDQSSTTVGISAFDLTTSTPAKVNSTLDLLEGLGVTDIRISIPWNSIESYPGVYDWTQLDTIVNEAAARNMGVVGILEKTPGWAVRPGQPPVAGPPRSPEYLASFATAVASRYTGKIAAYEVYNEPNFSLAFSTLSPADYTAMLKAVYPAIKAADPDALVIGGVVASAPAINFLTVSPESFVQGMYAAGAKDYFDALSFHPYNFGLRFSQTADLPSTALFQLAAIRALMVANGDTDRQIWITEYGAPSSTNGEGQQAALITDFLNTWMNLPYAGPAFIHTAIDRATGTTIAEDNFGIFTSNLTAKLAAQIVAQAIAGTLPTTSDPVATEQSAIASTIFINSLAATWNALTSVFKPFVDAFNAVVSAVLDAITPRIPTPVPPTNTTTSALRTSADTNATLAADSSETGGITALESAGPTAAKSSDVGAADETGTPGQTEVDESSAALVSADVDAAGDTTAPSIESTTDEPTTTDGATSEGTTADTTPTETTPTDTTGGSGTGGSSVRTGGGSTTAESTTTGGSTTAGSTTAGSTTAGSTTNSSGASTSGSSAAASGDGASAGSTGSASTNSEN